MGGAGRGIREAELNAGTPTTLAGQRPERQDGLDGLRAVAVVLVLVSHFWPDPAGGESLQSVRLLGWLGVDLFFVLSGFLITRLLLDEEAACGRVSLELFYARRFVRIVPPLAAFLAVLAGLSAAGAVAVPATDFVAGLFFVRNFVPGATETQHLWSLAIEEQFYLAWPLALARCRSQHARAGLCAAAFCLVPVWQSVARPDLAVGTTAPMRTDVRLQPILGGSLLALLDAVPAARLVLASAAVTGPAACAVALGGACVAAAVSTPATWIAGTPWPSVFCLGAVLLVNSVARQPRSLVCAALSLPPCVWVGRLSYSLYLWQQLFASALPETEPGWFRAWPAGLALTVLAACASYYAVERPFVGLRRRLRPARVAPR